MRSGNILIITLIIAMAVINYTVDAQSYLENLTRGLVAIKTRDGYFLSWRLLGHEDYATAFNVYRGGTSDLRSCTNKSAGRLPSSANFLCWWDGDLLREILNSNQVSKYGGDVLLTANGCSSINGTKSTPVLSADLFGDWREEVIFSCGGNLKIFTTTIPTEHKLYTLMHDRQYRCAIAWQNVAYNQPPHPGFFIGDGMELPPKKPNIKYYNDPIVGTVSVPAKSIAVPGRSSAIPVYSNRSFSVPGFISDAKIDVTVYSLSGKLLRSKEVRKEKLSLETDLGLPFGTYLVQYDALRK